MNAFRFISRCLSVILLLMLTTDVFAQDPQVLRFLKSKYSLVQYHKECGGWYFISYQKNNQTFYGFADSKGNVVASTGEKYKIHPGFIELYILDMNQKAKHDQWVVDKRQYDEDYANYIRIKTAYNGEVAAYNAKVEAAKSAANVLYEQAKKAAVAKAEYEQKVALQNAQNSGNNLVASLTAINSSVAVLTAAKSVQYQPILDQVLADRGLTVPPTEPYNPYPVEPKEPSSGYSWISFPLRQPSSYTFVEYDRIADGTGFANVEVNGKYGLVDAYFNVVISCSNSQKVLRHRFSDTQYLLLVDGKYGVIDDRARRILPFIYSSIQIEGSNFIVEKNGKFGLMSGKGKEIMPCIYEEILKSNGYLLCRKNSQWGVYTAGFQELYPCQFQQVEFEKFNDKLMLVTQVKGLYGVVDFRSGKLILPNDYAKIEKFVLSDNEEVFKVFRNNKYGVYTADGVLLLPCEFSEIKIVKIDNRNTFEVKKDKVVGLFETSGIPIIDVDGGYEHYVFQGSFFQVSKDGLQGVCSIYGEEVVPCKYSGLFYDSKLNGFIAQREGRFGVVSMMGEELFPFVGGGKLTLQGDYLLVDGGYKKCGAIDLNGNFIVPTKFKFFSVDKQVKKYRSKIDITSSYREKHKLLLAAAASLENRCKEIAEERACFSFFARNYVERIVNDWQRRGEFEKMDTWKVRVNNDTRKQKVYALTKEAQARYIEDQLKHLPGDKLSIVGYDPDNEVYNISSQLAGKNILVPVNLNDAQEFKSNFASIRKEPTFFVENDRLGVAEYSFFLPNGKVYKYNNQASLVYSIAKVEYNFDDIEIDKSVSNNGYVGGKQTVSTSTISIGRSDVDVAIPKRSVQQQNTFAVIIANENYEREKKVDFAYNDGEIFKDYCIKTLGIPNEHISYHSNATLNNMKFAVNWIKEIAEAFAGNARFIIYYAGHGIPDEVRSDAYLLPTDGFCSDLSTAYKLSSLYEALGSIQAERIVVFLDACFSGVQRSGEVMASARGVALRARIDKPKGNMIVFTAASGVETAWPYAEKQHGLFTYFILKKLQSSNGRVKLGELTDFVRSNVARISIVANKKSQRPIVIAADKVKSIWREFEL